MTRPKQLKICKCCNRTFVPQLSDEEILHLWFDEDELENRRHMRLEFGAFPSGEHIPAQLLCGPCISDPDLKVVRQYGVDIKYVIEKKQAPEEGVG